jgi:solute carrier family 35 (adenosine 3'-phospho 5'-phosphosulfate transporter), member B2
MSMLCLVRAGTVTSKASRDVLDSSLFGCLLMVGYLGFDGFTSTWQDKMFKGYSMSIYNQILYVQLCSACVSFTSLVMFGQVRPCDLFSALLASCPCLRADAIAPLCV